MLLKQIEDAATKKAAKGGSADKGTDIVVDGSDVKQQALPLP